LHDALPISVVPVVQSAAADLAGWTVLGEPRWTWVGMQPGNVFPIQIGFVVLGAIGSLALAHALSEREYQSKAAAAAAPWAAVTLAVATLAIWILAQPMDLRGTIGGG